MNFRLAPIPLASRGCPSCSISLLPAASPRLKMIAIFPGSKPLERHRAQIKRPFDYHRARVCFRLREILRGRLSAGLLFAGTWSRGCLSAAGVYSGSPPQHVLLPAALRCRRCNVTRVLDQETLRVFDDGNRSSAACVWSANSLEAIVSYDEELDGSRDLIDSGVNITLAGG